MLIESQEPRKVPPQQKNKHNMLTKLPGIFYRFVGDFVGEKLPIVIFTNRISFKMALSHQIEFYEGQRRTIQYQVNQVEREMAEIRYEQELSNKDAFGEFGAENVDEDSKRPKFRMANKIRNDFE